MNRVSRHALLAVTLLAFTGLCDVAAAPRATASARPADLVLVNGAIYTLDAARSWANAVAVRGGKIVFVGTDEGAHAFIGGKTRIIDLKGRMLLPSFQDSHAHASAISDPKRQIDFAGLQDREAIFSQIKAFAANRTGNSWLTGGGWDEAAFLPSGRPTRQMLDALVADRPVYLINNSRHQAWVNSAALAAAGITRDTPNPLNGEIVRDANGEPTGSLQETAMLLVRNVMPPPTLAERAADLEAALKQMNSHGITAAVEAAAEEDTVNAYAELARTKRLTTRVRICQRFNQNDLDDAAQIQRFLAQRERLANASEALDANCVKLLLDGGYGSRSVALLKPYVIPELGSGKLFIDPERLNPLITRLDAHGFQVHIHAIGDRSVRAGLDAVEVARKSNPRRGLPHTFAHLSLVDLADAPRFRQLDVMPNMTPVWSKPDPWQTVFAVEMFGAERANNSYRTRSLAEDGAVLVWGSDWPVTGVATLDGIETAVTHRHPGGRDPSGREDAAWNPDERLSLDRALVAYTSAGAALLGESARRGSIEVGKDADLVVLGRNLFETPPLEIHRVSVDLTLRQGKVLHEALLR